MNIRTSLRLLAVMVLGGALPFHAYAQGGTTTTETSLWQGSDPTKFVDGQRFYLYNVGAGKFITAGGLWNTEAMLLLQDYGMPFVLQVNEQVGSIGTTNPQTVTSSQTVLQSGMSSTTNASFGGCNVAGWTTSSSAQTLYDVILDASSKGTVGNYYYWRSVSATPVTEGSSNYVLKETIHRFTAGGNDQTSEYYIYAATNDQGALDHVAYTSTAVKSTVSSTDVNYLWRCVLPDELTKAVNAQNGDNNGGTYGGLAANVTYLLHDPNFDRAQTDFSTYSQTVNGTTTTHNTWTVKASNNVATEIDHDQNPPRYDWTAHDHLKSDGKALFDPLTSNEKNAIDRNVPSATVHTFTILPSDVPYTADADKGVLNGDAANGIYRQPWNGPVFRKLEASDVDGRSEWPGSDYKMRNIQYEMGTLEGEGEAYQTVSFTTNGRYMLTVHAFAVGDGTTGTVFARPANGGTGTSKDLGDVVTPNATLWTQGNKRTNVDSYFVNIFNSTQQNWTVVAKQLDETPYITLLFNVTGASEDSPVQWEIGISKSGSKKSDNALFNATRKYLSTDTQSDNGNMYYYYSDQNYVAIDNMQLHYLGSQEPFLFDEQASDVSYMSSSKLTNDDNTVGFKNRNTYLRRDAAINKWQTIVLPVSLTTEQVRQAFGDDVRLGKLEGVGKATDKQSPASIDFSSVTLNPGQTAIQAWNYYLIYATRSAGSASWTVTNADGTTTTVSGSAYLLGRVDYNPSSISRTFNNNGTDEDQTKSIDGASFSDVIYGSKYAGSGTAFDGGDQDLKVNGTWVRKVGAAPAHSYYVSNNEMYYLTNAQTVRGFKWWITAGAATQARGLKFNFVNPDQSIVTFIDGVSVDRKDAGRDDAVYTLAGVRVADNASALKTLPKGIYISGGKKIINR